MPTGVSGMQTKVIAPAAIAVILPSLVRTCGMIKATNAAGKAASRPHAPGSLRTPPTVSYTHLTLPTKA